MANTHTPTWLIEFIAEQNGVFFRPEHRGNRKVLLVNVAHPFYRELYRPAPQGAKSGLEVLLLVLAERELDAESEDRSRYQAERHKWSSRLDHALVALSDSLPTKGGQKAL